MCMCDCIYLKFTWKNHLIEDVNFVFLLYEAVRQMAYPHPGYCTHQQTGKTTTIKKCPIQVFLTGSINLSCRIPIVYLYNDRQKKNLYRSHCMFTTNLFLLIVLLIEQNKQKDTTRKCLTSLDTVNNIVDSSGACE